MEFSADEVDRAIDESVEEEVKGLADRALVACVELSPVDSGKFRGSWELGVNGAEPVRVVDRLDPSGQTTIAAGRAEIRGYKRGNVIIESALPYSARIDNGWSLSAPAGVTRLAAIAALSIPPKDDDI